MTFIEWYQAAEKSGIPLTLDNAFIAGFKLGKSSVEAPKHSFPKSFVCEQTGYTIPYTPNENEKRLAVNLSIAAQALELIAAGVRPDGTYNRSREACERLAKNALLVIKAEAQEGGELGNSSPKTNDV